MGTGLQIIAYNAVMLALCARVLMQPRLEPSARLAWVLVIAVLPFVGILGYVLFGEIRVGRAEMRARRGARLHVSRIYDRTAPPWPDLPPWAEPVALSGQAVGGLPIADGNRLTLLRFVKKNAAYEMQGVFAENLNAPYGLALVDGQLFVANQDAVVRFDYVDGQTTASGPPETLTLLPSEINHHWTKAMTASADGRFLYVGIGSNSNITERGIAAEEDRAMVWQIDTQTGAHRPYATGLRNPTALAIQPGTGQLWAVVNERDEIGPDLVPDYLTSVQEGAFYGWPYSYWGQTVDPRAQPQDPEKVASAIAPDYALGSHVAALGVSFSTPAMGADFADGVFVGEHGSWNRDDPVGYKVIFVPFQDGRPAGDPVDFVTGFLLDEGNTRGRPVGVTVDPRGAVIVADDLSNTVWRITPAS